MSLSIFFVFIVSFFSFLFCLCPEKLSLIHKAIYPFVRYRHTVYPRNPSVSHIILTHADLPSACGSVATTISKRCCHHMPTPYQSSKKPTHLKNPIIKRLESGNPSCNTDYVTVTASTIRELRARDVASPIQLTIPRLHDFWPIYLHFLFNA